MDRQPRRNGADVAGFTVVLCDNCEHGGDLPVLSNLREVIRRCPHGVLIRARCPLGRLWCHTRKTAGPSAGHVVLVQPCTSTRRPVGAVIPVGPVRSTEDLAALARWLESTPLSPAELPRRLREIPRHTNSN
ncbi:hypothetical protein [Saccharopolyspora sp. 5N708]|uniref:hypothetical protein n=1 Tax=Saccharopolyspora sp. 5N708 TaxID=3457424 RepID=UPI003FD0C0B2